ncbi:SIR2 family protein [Aquirufa salirivi]|uniref:SIR2 family protein n=1 Tax=Aquirufa salirivi TaxID=3104729 RepID=A0ABW8RW43_9BACT
MNQEFKADIKRILEASENDQLVIFIGAGVSINSGIPSWKDLIAKLVNELPESIKNSGEDFLKIAQLYKNHRGQKEYLDKIRLELKNGKATFNPIHEVIFKLKPAHIVTTNYDDLLEQAILFKNLQYYVINKDNDLPFASYNKHLIKMHGDLNIGNIVLTEDDYLNYSINFPLIESYVKSLFASKLILFIGFSFNDYNLKIITNSVKNLLKDDFQLTYLLNTGKTDFISKDYYKKRGVKIIDYPDIIENEIYSNSVSNKLDISKLNENDGKKLYTLINYISEFNFSKNDYEENSIIDYLYDLIQNNFNELRVIGGVEISKLKPFKIELNQPFFNFSLKFKPQKKISTLRNELSKSIIAKRIFLKNYSKKYRAIIKFAKLNGILEINHKDEAINKSIKLSNWEKDNKTYGLDLYYNLNFKDLLIYIENLRSITKDKVTVDDLELPFLLYKTGNYFEAHNKFRELAQKYWKGGQYIHYFICQNNIKNISNLLINETFYSNKDINIAKEILNESNNIDLDDILYRIKKNQKNVYTIIEEIYNNSFVIGIINSIDELTNNINKSYQIAINDGFSLDSNVENLLDKTFNLWNFTNNNYIASEHFKEHILIYKKAFEGFIISNNIPENNSDFWSNTSKLNHLLPFHILIILFDVKVDFLINLFSEKDIKKLNLEEKGLKYLHSMAFNSIESLELPISENKILNLKIYGVVENLLVILSKIDSDCEFNNHLIEKIIDEKHINLHLLEKALVYFTSRKIKNIDIKNQQNLIKECILRSTGNRLPTKLIHLLIKNNESSVLQFLLENEDILNKLSAKEFFLKDDNFYLQCLLFNNISKSNQNIFEERIREELNENFNLEKFRFIHGFKLPFTNLYKKLFIDKMKEYFNSSSKSSKEYFNIKCFSTIIVEDNLLNDEPIKQLIEHNSFLNFLIHTDEFIEEQEINLDWLHYLEESQFDKIASNKKILAQIQEELKIYPQNKWLLNIYFKYFSKP